MTGNARRFCLAILVAGVWLACGGESEPTAGGAASAPTPAAPVAVTPGGMAPAPPVTAADLYEWDLGQGPARDLTADSSECQSQITGEGLTGVAQHIQCMQQKGWKTRPPAG